MHDVIFNTHIRIMPNLFDQCKIAYAILFVIPCQHMCIYLGIYRRCAIQLAGNKFLKASSFKSQIFVKFRVNKSLFYIHVMLVSNFQFILLRVLVSFTFQKWLFVYFFSSDRSSLVCLFLFISHLPWNVLYKFFVQRDIFSRVL